MSEEHSKSSDSRPSFLSRKQRIVETDGEGHIIETYKPYPSKAPYTDGYNNLGLWRKNYEGKTIEKSMKGNEWVLDLPLIDYPITDWKSSECPVCLTPLTLQDLGSSIPRYVQVGDCGYVVYEDNKWIYSGEIGRRCYEICVLCPMCHGSRAIWEVSRCTFHGGPDPCGGGRGDVLE